jgi:hypothetical protein
MKITIDTKIDSPDDIRKVVALLSNLVGARHTNKGNIFSDYREEEATASPVATTNAFANMFNEQPVTNSVQEKEEVVEDIPKIIEY